MSDATSGARPVRRRRARVLSSITLAFLAIGIALTFGATSYPAGEGRQADSLAAPSGSPADGITRAVPAAPEQDATAWSPPGTRLRAPDSRGLRDALAPAQRPPPVPPATPVATRAGEPAAPPDLPGPRSRELANTLMPPGDGEPRTLPLDVLSPEAAALARQSGAVGVAVFVANEGVLYSEGGLTPFPLASLAKLPIMLTALDQVADDARSPSDDDRALLDAMITVSDNAATSALWEQIGGGAAVAAYLRAAGIEGIGPASNHEWGDTQGTAAGVARLLMVTAQGELPHPEHRDAALNLLAGVIEEHRWGVTAGFRPGPGARALLVKNGWFPAEDGWWVNSAGVVVADDGSPRYTIAVLSRGRPSYEAGRLLIEVIAARIHAAMRVR